MANKEWLAEYADSIRNNLSEIIGILQEKEDLKERVQELEKRCHYLNNELFSERTIKNEFQQGIEEQGKRIKELEHVLAFYADKKSYTEMVNDEWGAATAILVDRGKKARQVLRGKQNA